MKPAYRSVFDLQIWNYFKNDIESCFLAARRAKTNDGEGGQNFTAATVILTVLDFCAGYYHGKLKITSSEVSEFLTKYLGDIDPLFSNLEFTDQFYKVFRHGLVHQWSPKFSGVAMDFEDSRILYYEGVLVLNVPPFFHLVCKALKNFEEDLDNNTDLQRKFESRLKEILEEDAAEAVKLRELLDKSITE